MGGRYFRCPPGPTGKPRGGTIGTDGQGLRVCILTETFHPIVGGGESHARLLGEALVARGVDVFVLTQRRPRGVGRTDLVGRIPVRRVMSSGHVRWGKFLMMGPTFVRLLISRDRYDLIYVCGLRTLGIPALSAGKLLGKPVVLRAESRMELSGADVLQCNPAVLRWLIRRALWLRNRLYRGAARYVSISEDVSEEFRGCGVPERQLVRISNGIDVGVNRPAEPGEPAKLRERFGLPLDKTLVVYTGKLNRGKGLEMLLRAWKRLDRDDLSRAHLVLVGGGANQFLSCEEELRAYVIGSELQSHVTFTGYVTNVSDYLRASDVFTLPSESESFSLSLAEAMSCGLPSVVTGVGGMVELVRDGQEGLLIPVNGEDELVVALRRLLDDGEVRRRMGIVGRRTVVERFSIDTIAAEHERLFRRLARHEGAA